MQTLQINNKEISMIQQTIEFNSYNLYFAGFLQSLINDSGINASVEQKKNKIILKIDETDQNVLEYFSSLVAKYLPHSIFLGTIENTQSDEKNSKTSLQSPNYSLALCPKCLAMITDPSHEKYLDDSIVCDHYSNSGEFVQDSCSYSPHYSQGDTLLITDSSTISDLFLLTAQEQKALFSIEKPTLKVTIKDQALIDQTGKKFIKIKSPYSVKSTLVALNAKESGVPYLFFHDTTQLHAVVVQNNLTLIQNNRLPQNLKDFHEDRTINRMFNIMEEANFNKGAIGVNLNSEQISFIVCNENGAKKVIEFKPFDLEETLSLMQQDPIKNKLLQNFEAKYPNVMHYLHNNPKADLYSAVCVILDIDPKSLEYNNSFELLSDKSYEFHGNGGLKIDTYFSEQNFDYVSFLGSIISFKLANADNHYIAYSIFEALGDMSITVLNQLKTKFKIEQFVMMGNMFGNSVLYSRILSKFQLSNPFFSKMYALDE